jgi:uncharacterized protein (TIGR04255 family)
MNIYFVKAPLVELIAELRWVSAPTLVQQSVEQQPAAMPVLFFGDTKIEEFFMRLGGELYQSGFRLSERLVPAGFPTNLHQPVFRYKSDTSPQKSVLYQVGAGVFSVHGIPPYRSWDTFSPSVKKGIEALLKSRGAAEEKEPFTQVSLRYVDFFGEDLIQGRSIVSFVSDVLGISTKLPVALTEVATPSEVRSLYLKFALPLAIGTLNIGVGDGRVNNQPGIVLDTILASTAAVAPKIDAIMNTFNAGHKIIHKMFFDLTRPIHKLMEPQGQDL